MTIADQSDEETPLLDSSSSPETLESFPRPNLISRNSFVPHMPHIHTVHTPRTIVALLMLIMFVLNFGMFLMAVPGLRIYEDIICHQYYARQGQGEGFRGLEGDIDEKLCKGLEVQNELSFLLAGLHVVGALPPLIVTIPYGFLADRIGRKPIFVLAISGLLMGAIWQMTVMWFWKTIPLRLVWLGPLFQVIGGGETVAAIIFYSIASDVTPEANRAFVFSLGWTAGLVAEFIAPSVATYLMKSSSWTSMIAGISIVAFGTIVTLFIPETLHMRPRVSTPSHLTPSPSAVDLPSEDPESKKSTSMIAAIKKEFATTLQTLTSSIQILSSIPILLLVITFIIQPICRQAMDLSLRYTSTRFEFPLRYSSLLISLRAAVTILLLLVILPAITYFLTKRLSFTSPQKDLFLARASILVLTTGMLIIAASPTLPLTITGMGVHALGMGYFPLVRSLLASLVRQHQIAQIYSQIGIMEVVGALVSGPSLAGLYVEGLARGGAWAGLPFFVVWVVGVVACTGTWVAGFVIRRRGWRDHLVETTDELPEEEVLLGRESERDVLDSAQVGTMNAGVHV